MGDFPKDLPPDFDAAFAHLASVEKPSIDDFKIMIYLEASGKAGYGGLAQSAPNDEVRSLFEQNGAEEMGHAHRVRRVIQLLSGEDFQIPSDDENPYVTPPQPMKVTKELCAGIAEGEFGGEGLYEAWAKTVDNETAAELLRLNGKEERIHGERAQKAATLL
jgi:rubrerythrin